MYMNSCQTLTAFLSFYRIYSIIGINVKRNASTYRKQAPAVNPRLNIQVLHIPEQSSSPRLYKMTGYNLNQAGCRAHAAMGKHLFTGPDHRNRGCIFSVTKLLLIIYNIVYLRTDPCIGAHGIPIPLPSKATNHTTEV